jgi:hypothetical protein
MRYARDAATGRLTYEEDHYIGDNTTGVIARRHGGFMTTAAYRYPASVPLIREYPTSDFRMYETEVEPMRFVFSGRGALTTPGNDFGPVPANIWGIVEAPTGIFYAAALGRTELRGTTARDTRILRIDPAFPAMPDGVDRSDAAALGGDSAYLGLRRLEADDRYLYWVTGTDENFASDPYPAQPHRVARSLRWLRQLTWTGPALWRERNARHQGTRCASRRSHLRWQSVRSHDHPCVMGRGQHDHPLAQHHVRPGHAVLPGWQPTHHHRHHWER